MHILRKHLRLGHPVTLLAAALCSTVAGAAWAEYPEHPVKIMVGYAPGGGSDIMARILADKLASELGQPFLVENKPGAATTLAASLTAKAPADGYTIMMTTLGTAISSYQLKDLTYDYGKDLQAIGMIATNDFAIVVPKDSQIKTIEDMIRIGKENELTFSSSGINSPSHLIGQEIANHLGLKVNHVAYSGGGEALTAVLGGEVDFNLSVTANAAPVVSQGQVRGIAITSREGNPQTPDLQPLAKTVIPDYEGLTWYGLVGPAGMPEAVIDKLNAGLNAALSDAEVVKKLEEFGYTIRQSSAEEFQAYSLSEIERWSAAATSAAP